MGGAYIIESQVAYDYRPYIFGLLLVWWSFVILYYAFKRDVKMMSFTSFITLIIVSGATLFASLLEVSSNNYSMFWQVCFTECTTFITVISAFAVVVYILTKNEK